MRVTPDGVEGSALVPAKEADAFYAQPEDTLVMIGFTEAQLAPALALDRSWLDSPLRSAVGCEPKLPVPTWSARVADSGSLATPFGDVLPELTAEGLTGVCPDVAPEDLTIDLLCEEEPCVADIDHLGCFYRIDLSGCGHKTVDVTLDAFGGACIAAPPEWPACVEQDDTAYAAGTFLCQVPAEGGGFESCRVDIEVAQPPEISVGDPIVVVDGAPGAYPQDEVFSEGIQRGPLLDFLVRDDETLVVSGFTSERQPLRCIPRQAHTTSFFFLDTSSGALLERVDAPACTDFLAPHGDGFTGIFVDTGGDYAFGAFDARGALTSSAALGSSLSRPGGGTLVQARFAPAEDVMYALFQTEGAFEVLAIDRRTRVVRAVTDTAVDSCNDLTLGAADDLFVACDDFDGPDGGRLLRFSRAGVALDDSRFDSNREVETAFTISDIHHHAASGTTWIATGRDYAGLFQWVTGDVYAELFNAEAPLQAGILATWSDDRILYTGVYPEGVDRPQTAVLQWVDVAPQHLVPGYVELGPGLVTRARRGPDGRMWLLNARAGTVFPLEPR